MMRLICQAICEWNMINDGDRLVLGLSGGKDSLCLLHALLWLQKRAPIRFTLACATVDPTTPSFDPSALIPYSAPDVLRAAPQPDGEAQQGAQHGAERHPRTHGAPSY